MNDSVTSQAARFTSSASARAARALALVPAALLLAFGVGAKAASDGTARVARPQIYAVVVGNNAAPRGADIERLPDLQYADDDAVRYDQFFSSLGAKSWLLAVLDEETQRRHPGTSARARRPTRGALEQAIRDVAEQIALDAQRGTRSIFFFAFSGHGGRQGKGAGFLSLLDGRLTRQALYEQLLARIPAHLTHLFIDACYADSVVGARGAFEREADAQSVAVSRQQARSLVDATTLDQFPHVGVLAATGSSQEAHEWSTIQAGVFTHEVLSGLRGAADVNADGEITYSEIHAFIDAANREVRNPKARLSLIARPPAGSLAEPLVSLSWIESPRLLRGNYSRLGHFFLEHENGERFLDAHLSSRYGTALFLPRGTVFLKTADRETVIAAGEGGAIRLAALTFAPAQERSRGSVGAAYRAALFRAPYGPSYYRGHVDSTGGLSVQFAQATPETAPAPRLVRARVVAPEGLSSGSPSPHRFALLSGPRFQVAEPGIGGGAALVFDYTYGERHQLLVAPRLFLPFLGARENHAEVTGTIGYRLSVGDERWRAGVHLGLTSGVWFGDDNYDVGAAELYLGGQLGTTLQLGHFTLQLILEGGSLPMVSTGTAAYPMLSSAALAGFSF